MSHIPAVKSLMTPFPHAIDTGASVQEARVLMAEEEIRHLAVTERGELVGVLSERDVRLVLGSGSGVSLATEATVGDLVHRDAYVVDLETPLDEVLLEMAERHIGSALVTRRGKLAGIVTTTDVCRGFAEALRDRPRRGPDDAA